MNALNHTHKFIKGVRQQLRGVPVLLLSSTAPVERPAAIASPEPKGTPASGAVQFADLPEPATEHRQTLARLVQAGAVTDILRWADALAQDAPELAHYAAQVRTAALAMDFVSLQQMASHPTP